MFTDKRIAHACLLTAFALNVICTQTASVFTDKVCTASNCPNSATPPADDYRSLGNKVSGAFGGYVDTWASSGATTFTTDMMVTSAQAWPRISEGTTTQQHTPGYPISVRDYLRVNGGRYISYSGWWAKRTNGPNAGGSPRGPRYNGAYIWLNDPANFRADGKSPIWPYTIEINVWNRHDNGIRSGAERSADYYDSNGRYEVWGHDVDAEGDKFFAYYVILKDETTTDMVINVKALLRHLRDTTSKLKNWHELVEICVAAEGHAGADAKFGADINTMGRP
ncbi:Glycoside hydrolase 11/12 [Gracilaria domingensis]|nr:Glycoside hydrolase 11/12 [Gracilaria domingensis]